MYVVDTCVYVDIYNICVWCDVDILFLWYVNFVSLFVPHAHNPVHFERSFALRAYQTVRVCPVIIMTRTRAVVTACAAVQGAKRKKCHFKFKYFFRDLTQYFFIWNWKQYN